MRPVASWCGLLVLALVPTVVRGQSQSAPFEPAHTNSHLEIGPVADLTVAWHPAPVRTAAPLGAVLSFRVPASAAAAVRWEGAQEIARGGGRSMAQVELLAPGDRAVVVEFETVAGELLQESIELEVVDISEHPVSFDGVRLDVDPPATDPEEAALLHLFRGDSIAALREVGERRFRTSINRWMKLEVDVEPPGFAPLVEWHLDGIPQRHLGSPVRLRTYVVGLHRLTAGPAAAKVELETYRVEIAGAGEVVDGVPLTLRAVTDPPGLEQDVTWMAATESGSTSPLAGEGEAFTTLFQSTFGPLDPVLGVRGQTLGVRADNALLAQVRHRPLLAVELAHLKLETKGWVSIEFTGSCADFRHWMRLVAPPRDLFSSATLPGTVELLGELEAGASLEFELVVEDPLAPGKRTTLKSSDNLRVHRLDPGTSSGLTGMWVLAWEDTVGLGDQDFNDFLAIVRIAKDPKAVEPTGFNARTIFGTTVTQGVVSDFAGTPYPLVAGKDTLVRLHLNTPCPPCSSDVAGGELRLYERKGQHLIGPSATFSGGASLAVKGAKLDDVRESEIVDFRVTGTALARAEELVRPGFLHKIEYVAEAQVSRNTLDGPDPVPAACLRVPLPRLTRTRPWTVLVVPVGRTEDEAKALLVEDLPLPLDKIFDIYVAANPLPTPTPGPGPSREPWVIVHPTRVHLPPPACFVAGITTIGCASEGAEEILTSWNEEGSTDRCPTPTTCRPKAAALVVLLPDRLWRNGESPGFTEPVNRFSSCPPVPQGKRLMPLVAGVVLDTKHDLLPAGPAGEPETSYIFTHEVGHTRGLVPSDRGDGGAHAKGESGPWGWSPANGQTAVPAGSVMGGSSGSSSDVFFKLEDYLCLIDQVDDPPPALDPGDPSFP